MQLFDLSGKTAIITGASRGIGEAIARQMADHGSLSRLAPTVMLSILVQHPHTLVVVDQDVLLLHLRKDENRVGGVLHIETVASQEVLRNHRKFLLPREQADRSRGDRW